LGTVEDAAFAPARQLGDGRRAGAGSARMHMSAVEVDLVYIVGARVAQDWSSSGGDAAEGVVVVEDAACRAVKSATKDAISVEAVAKAHAGTVA
jgi:hypothetical protein